MAVVNNVSGSMFDNTGLKAYYKLSDETDSSSSGLNLLNTGVIVYSAGKFGNCGNFPRTQKNYLSSTGNVSIARNVNHTLSAWVNFTDVAPPSGTVYGILSYGQTVDHYRTGLDLEYTTASTVSWRNWVQVNGVSDDRCIWTDTPIAGIWYHICGTYDYTNTGKMYLYINGVLRNSLDIDKTGVGNNETNGLCIGSIWILGTADFDGNGSFVMKGKIDEAMIFSRAWTTQEVYNYYQQYTSALGMGSNY
jgi:hypothetical protein